MSSISSKFYKGSASGDVPDKETVPTSQKQHVKSMCQPKISSFVYPICIFLISHDFVALHLMLNNF